MSREESLKKVKGYLISYLPSDMSDEIEDICSALEQEPCGDCVSRQEVLSEVKSGMIRPIDGENWKRVSDNVRDILALPPVSPQPKMGRWNFTKHYGRDYYVCLVCGMERMDDHSSGWNYCPNCGAKMQEVEE